MVFVRDEIPHKRCSELEVNVDTCGRIETVSIELRIKIV